MKTRYVIVDEEKRAWFEKEWHLPYGYSNSYITFDIKDAIVRLNGYHPDTRENFSIEMIDEYGNREIIYEEDKWVSLER